MVKWGHPSSAIGSSAVAGVGGGGLCVCGTLTSYWLTLSPLSKSLLEGAKNWQGNTFLQQLWRRFFFPAIVASDTSLPLFFKHFEGGGGRSTRRLCLTWEAFLYFKTFGMKL